MLMINDLKRHHDALASELSQALSRVTASGRFVLGPEVEGFETEFAAYVGAAHCVAVASGTDALELALRAVGVGAGAKVLTVANAGFYSTTAITLTGAQPIYADVNADSALLDVAAARRVMDEQSIDAIIVTHLYGSMVAVPAVLDHARSRNIPVIEDCAQAHGAARDGRKAGSLGDVGCFSFYPTKNLGALGDGGALLTSRPDLAQRLRQLRQYGWDTKYHSVRAGGRNSRLDEVQAAVLRVKLPYLDRWNARRRAIAAEYCSRIRHDAIELPALRCDDQVVHLFVIRSARRDDLRRHLAAYGIASDVHYPIPDYRQPSCAQLSLPPLPVTERLCETVLTLPCFPEMTHDEVDRVIQCVNDW